MTRCAGRMRRRIPNRRSRAPQGRHQRPTGGLEHLRQGDPCLGDPTPAIGIICKCRRADRNVVLTDDQEQFVESLLESGPHQNASEVTREALRLIEGQVADDAAKAGGLAHRGGDRDGAIEAGAYKEFLEPGSLRTYLSGTAEEVVRTRRRAR
jgi:antitoxin ParD1/3/4